ncbi:MULTISPECIES: biotin-dependent carboxyltransferase family protein [unclassified Streptomyces]|uniref:5-oxoprolinase subunit C family protein n=1 Tax=unclassified Streptomyces TaxID=2593676 RepID=UPI002E321281|nr:biotin-dependent carboxyltransferase family protein [Streptomyces sp. NBC_01361]
MTPQDAFAVRELEVLSPGPLATVQDLGRPGWSHLGVSRSGAADTTSLTLANRLVGNPEDAAGLEITFGGLQARLHLRRPDGTPATGYLALTGAPCPATVNGRPAAVDAPVPVRDGDILALGMPSSGLRTYLAVRGGLTPPPSLGSRATDLLSGTGPALLRSGDTLPVGAPEGPMPGVDHAPRSAPPSEFVLRVWLGPRDDWFEEASLQEFFGARWEATSKSNRVGIRLAGPALQRSRTGELPAEGMVRGALQVPPNGQPVLFLVDHPVTGGYPVIGVVHEDDLPLAGQIPPGAPIRFRPVGAPLWPTRPPPGCRPPC